MLNSIGEGETTSNNTTQRNIVIFSAHHDSQEACIPDSAIEVIGILGFIFTPKETTSSHIVVSYLDSPPMKLFHIWTLHPMMPYQVWMWE